MLSNGEQAEILKDWLGWWNLTPNDLSVFMDDAIFARNGSPKGSVSGDFRQSGVRMTPVEKNVVSLESGLGASRSGGWCGHVRDYEGRRHLDLWPIELAAGVTSALTALWSTEAAFRLAHDVHDAGASSMRLLLEEEA